MAEQLQKLTQIGKCRDQHYKCVLIAFMDMEKKNTEQTSFGFRKLTSKNMIKFDQTHCLLL